jgi:DmsE family decaheme c-type cytochrome
MKRSKFQYEVRARVRGLFFWMLAGGLLFWGTGLSAALEDDAAAGGGETKTAASSEDYSVPESCAACHGDLVEKFSKTSHGNSSDPRNPAAKKSCETCHGSMLSHVLAGGGKESVDRILGKDSKLSAEERNQSCLQCHKTGKRALWPGSLHESKGLACADCHWVHAGNKKNLAKATEMDTCLQCHQNLRAEINRSSHHPIREGKVTCSDCHEPHGTTTDKLISAPSVNEKCFQCHAEKRGPFLHEHKPVSENCLICHQPHGATHDKLLTARAPWMCQSCHNINSGHITTYALGDPTKAVGSTFQRLDKKAIMKGCVNCHQNIHGSNHPSGHFFTR